MIFKMVDTSADAINDVPLQLKSPAPSSIHINSSSEPSTTPSSMPSNEESKPIISSKGWRIWAPSFHTVSGYSWDVRRLEFYEDENCEVLIDPVGTPIDSGNAGSGWGPSNVFDGGGLGWGGRFDDNDKAWIG